MELQTENGKKKVPLSTGLKWLRLVCMAVVFGIIAGGVMVGMNYLGGSMAAEEESIPQTSTVKVTAQAEDSDAVVAVAREAMPSVVTISTMSVEEMRSFFGGTQEIQVQGAGTGVIVNKNESELLIATNNHVVEGATQLSVGFVDQSSVEAQVKGTDVDNDLAVVAVQLSDIPAETLSQLKIATIGDSDELELGQPVVAIGNALGYGQSVTTGVVSALNRDLSLTDESGTAITSTGLIQTDAAINPGNSGGALVDMNGRVVGINSSKIAATEYEGLGFAIPSDTVQPIVSDLMKYGYVQDRPMLGITGQYLNALQAAWNNVPSGFLVGEVNSEEATRSGLQANDIITAIGDTQVTSAGTIATYIADMKPGDTVTLTVYRYSTGQSLQIDLVLSENTGLSSQSSAN